MHKRSAATAALAALLALPGAAYAADMPPRPAPVPVPMYAPPAFSWTGFYIGGNIGGAWAHRDITDTFGRDFGRTSDGVFIGGGQLGYNYQTGNFVFGVEWDMDAIGDQNNNNNVGVIVPGVGTIVVNHNDNWIMTLAARFGWTYNQWLLYAKVGGGWVNHNDFTVSNLTTGTSVTIGNENTRSGVLVGAGGEYAFGNNWTAKIEY